MQRCPALAPLVLLAALGLAAAAPIGSTAPGDPDSAAEVLGRPAPDWAFTRWVRGPERTLTGLRGQVVLVRWWTDGCRYCRSTLPVIESLRRRHAAAGLVTLGVYHAKPEPREVADREILRHARGLGFGGPIAFDRDWVTLGRYWLDGHEERNWTSVSFLIDREGVIRWAHGGGEYHPGDDPRHAACAEDFAGLEAALAAALAGPARP